MLNHILTRLLILCFLLVTPLLQGREKLSLNEDWKFQLAKQISNTPPPDSGWKRVQIPHDWSWEAGPKEDFIQGANGGYRSGGIGWYQTKFILPASFVGKTVSAAFDGVYRKSTVYLNGEEVGSRPNGYISFRHDLTPFLKGGVNTLTVRVDCRLEPSTRWYHPCGIYAPVTLEASPTSSRLIADGIFITTPIVKPEQAAVSIAAEVKAPSGLDLAIVIYNPSGRRVATTKVAAEDKTKALLVFDDPVLWSPDSPELYRASVKLMKDDVMLEQEEITFGIRTIAWNTQTGFLLNGKVTKIKGVCEHLTGGPVGGAWTEEMLEWKLRLLKEMGCNAIRTAHNPQTPAFYALCDRLGIMVLNEIFDGWTPKDSQDYAALDFKQWWLRDIMSWVRRDRNHPCVIAWSVGNETSGPVAGQLVALCHQIDPTRLVTSGQSELEMMDIDGLNEESESPKFFEAAPPKIPFLATGAPHTYQVRGFYKTQTWYRDGFPNEENPPLPTPNLTSREIFRNVLSSPRTRNHRKHVLQSSYDNSYAGMNARQHWAKVRDLPWVSGHFRWTGFDYPGDVETITGGWPFHTQSSGALDLAGFKKDLYYFYQSQWTTEPMVHLLPHWTHPTMKKETLIPVVAYTNAEEVELFLNKRSLGKKSPGKEWDQMAPQWMVPWEPGTLTAVASTNNQEVARYEVKSSSHPSALRVEANNHAPETPILDITITDQDKTPYPYGENIIFTNVKGSARILALESGSPNDPFSPVTTQRRAYMGKARLFLEGPASQITIGSILGERRQLTSNQVAIQVETYDFKGEKSSITPTIYYTVDGGIATSASTLYKEPFEIKPDTTVTAIAVVDGETVLDMKEQFGPTKGLYWTKPGEEIAE